MSRQITVRSSKNLSACVVDSLSLEATDRSGMSQSIRVCKRCSAYVLSCLTGIGVDPEY